MDRKVCVYCSSSKKVPEIYFDAAKALGTMIAAKGDSLVFGGTRVGLMEAVADAVKKNGGRVVGVVPETLHRQNIGYQAADELIRTKDMYDRKAVMAVRADAFIALAGGIGTLDEISEAIALKQLHYHNKPVVIINTNRFYHDLLRFFDRMVKEEFAYPGFEELYCVVDDAEAAYRYIERYKVAEIPASF
jgi:cytokinin riboside 5'-monophosphate phosphoribohydrolase